ncbi:urea ABC transporter membrane protein [Thalassoporum mexicanum PCC 7367]|uniref:ABC transporter permease subunit n=1 Tax=Thalassoporum mexicanum TaxID=3457544 RepID=UPI00029FFF51|nr:branched-chain amino acid ABC transporter permease [Pseudanabaena sp. PCC 7367]AFY71539.1 urea ABC transporter membrane protein [Pseudanabaena sp. PCC 7367]
MVLVLEGIFNGISTGSVLLLAALGLAIVFGLMGVINMAHGELLMIGGYTTFLVQKGFEFLDEKWFGFSIPVALIAAFLVTAIFGLILENGVIKYLYGRPLETLLATWGVSLILQQFVRSVNWVLVAGIAIFSALFFGGMWLLKWRLAKRIADWDRWQALAGLVLFPLSAGIAIAVGLVMSKIYELTVTKPWFGAQNVGIVTPEWLTGGLLLSDIGVPEPIGTIQLPMTRLFILGLTIACIICIYLFLNATSWGLRIRAVTQNRSMSSCLGIPTKTVDSLTFAIGSGLAGIAGCAVSFLGPVGPNTGQAYIVNAFMVVVVGGVGKLVGSIIAALGLGTIDYLIGSGTIALIATPLKPVAEFFTFFATSSMSKVMLFALIVAFLQFKPAGLFPQKGRTVDA